MLNPLEQDTSGASPHILMVTGSIKLQLVLYYYYTVYDLDHQLQPECCVAVAEVICSYDKGFSLLLAHISRQSSVIHLHVTCMSFVIPKSLLCCNRFRDIKNSHNIFMYKFKE